VKCTLAAPIRQSPAGEVMLSMKTVPVNQSLGPGFVSWPFLVISTLGSFLAVDRQDLRSTRVPERSAAAYRERSA
jgi:hypothetical protein